MKLSNSYLAGSSMRPPFFLYVLFLAGITIVLPAMAQGSIGRYNNLGGARHYNLLRALPFNRGVKCMRAAFLYLITRHYRHYLCTLPVFLLFAILPFDNILAIKKSRVNIQTKYTFGALLKTIEILVKT